MAHALSHNVTLHWRDIALGGVGRAGLPTTRYGHMSLRRCHSSMASGVGNAQFGDPQHTSLVVLRTTHFSSIYAGGRICILDVCCGKISETR